MKERFTKAGRKEFMVRLAQLIRIFNHKDNNKFIFGKKHIIVGFGTLLIANEDECLARIYELSDLLNVGVSLEVEKEGMHDGKTVIRRKIKWL